MNKFIFSLLTLISTVFVSCNTRGGREEAYVFEQIKPIVITRSQAEVVENGNSFAIQLFKDISTTKGNTSFLISPFGLQVGLCMLANGAEGETLDQIASALSWGDNDVESINQTYKTILFSINDVDKSTVLHSANSVWLDNLFSVKSPFLKVLNDEYGAAASNVDFGNPSTALAINKWCSDNTAGNIPSLLDQTGNGTMMMLINALYFKGIWSNRFEKSSTKKANFICSDGIKILTPFMRQNNSYMGYKDSEVSVCELPYGNGGFVLDVILPEKEIAFDFFLSSFTAEKWNYYVSYMTSMEVDLSLPKFEQVSSCGEDIEVSLKKQGVTKIFLDPNFNRISEAKVAVSSIIQKNVIAIDESGSEASSVTDIVLGLGSAGGSTTSIVPQKMVFNADHPFIYMIRERTSGVVLFIGSYRGF